MVYYVVTFFLDKKSNQKSQDGGILSAREAKAGPVRRHPPHRFQLGLSLNI
jgi:hypothetical protein